jgi:hypothetical protein
MVLTAPHVWLRSSGVLGGRLGSAQFDEYGRPASFAGTLANASPASSESLSIRGGAFRDESARIREVVVGTLGALLEPPDLV